jgi:hypothetical protein
MPAKKTETGKAQTKKAATEKVAKKPSLETLLVKAEKKDLIEFILQATKHNAEMKVKVEMFFADNSGQDLTDTYRNAISAALKLVKIKYDYIEPASLRKGIKPLKDLLKKAKASFAANNYRDVFSISKALIETLAEKIEAPVWSDYASNELDELIEAALDNLETIASEPIAPFLRDEIFNYLATEILNPKYVSHSIFADFFYIASDLADDAEKLKLLEANLTKLEKRGFPEKPWRQDSFNENILLLRARLYEDQNREAELTKLYESHLEIDSFRRILIKRHEDEGNLDLVEQLLKDAVGKASGGNAHSLWFKPYLELLQKRGKTKELRELTAPFKKINQFNETYFNIWKSTFSPSELPEVIEPVIKELENRYQAERKQTFLSYISDSCLARMAKLMSENGQWARLKTAMMAAKTFDEMAIFELYLAGRYPTECAEQSLTLIKTLLPNAMGESGHKPIVIAMRQLWEKPEYKTVIQKMVANFESLYKARRSLMDLLKKYDWS